MRLTRSAARRGKRKGRVAGGKVLARILYFESQRRPEAEDTRKRIAQAPNQELFRHPRTTGPKTHPKGGSQLLAAHAHVAEMAAAVPIATAWRPLGPFSMPHGQTYGKGPGCRPAISGRVAGIAVDPSNPAHILIASAGGGVWESSDTGASWAPRTDSMPSLSMGAIAFAPSNPSMVYAGTGEGDSTFVDSPNLLGAGLLRSTDGGTTWSVLATSPFAQNGFYDLVVDPLNANHLLAATTIGLFESTNGGTSWTERRAQRTWSVSMHPAVAGSAASTKEVFAGCADGVFRSANGGKAWTKVTLPGAPSSFERIEVCFAPSDGNIVYVAAAGPPDQPDPGDPNSTQPTPYVWRRAVASGTFAKATPPADLQTGQSWYDWFAAVAPNNPNVLYIGGINSHKGIRSATGVWTWSNISAKNSGDSIHPDQHAIAFSPADANVVYIGCDGGIFRSPNAGTSWQSLNKGLCTSEIEFLTQHPQFETWLLAGTQDNGTMQYHGQEVWHHIGDGDGGDCATNFDNPYICYHSFYDMGLMRSTKGGTWNTWPGDVIGPPVTPAESYPDGALFYPPAEANGPVVAQAGNKLFVSRDDGDHWTRVTLPLASGELCSALAIPVPTRIYAGTSGGKISRADFGGTKWTATTLTRPVAGFTSDIMVDSTNANVIYAIYSGLAPGASGHVFRSKDGGASWTNISAGLPDIAANAIEIDPAHPDTLFLAMDLGVFRSVNAGVAWSAFNHGLPNALVKDLVFHAPSRLLRAGTQARGVWEIPVDVATLPDVQVFLRDSAVDSGRLSPSPSGVNDPFTFGAQTFWFQSQDIKVDAPSFLTPSLAGVDFAVFGDDQSMVDGGIEFAAGLGSENPQRNTTVRVYVQVHNRGVKTAANVAVKVFFAAAGVTFPDLPTGFWTGFPSNTVPASSPWQPIAAHATLASVEPGKSQIAGFEWTVPSTAADATALLAIITADNDSIATADLNIANLVQGERKCGLRNVAVVNSAPHTAPPIQALPLSLGALDGSGAFSLHADAAAGSIVRGLIFSKRLAKLAAKAGLKRVKLTAGHNDELARLFAASPALKKSLDTSKVFALRAGALMESFSLAQGVTEPIVALIDPAAAVGRGSLMQVNEAGEIVGGITFEARG